MKIDFEGREWQLDEDRVTIKQGVVLHMTYRLTMNEWYAGLTKFDARCYHFLYWLMLQQNGEARPIADCDADLVGFAGVWAEARAAQEAEKLAEPEPDPTSPPRTGEAPASPMSGTQPDTTPPLPAFAPSTVS